MGKNQHSKDRLFITATEWAQEYGGKKRKTNNSNLGQGIPFDHCALSLIPFTKPAMLSNKTGVVFDLEHITKYIEKHGSDPVTGDAMTADDIIPLTMFKNAEGEYECSVTNRVFTASTHIVAIKTSGNIYSYDAVNELNIKAKNYTDLIDCTPFKKDDIVSIQDPQNLELMRRRDVSTFTHLSQVREDNAETRRTEPKLRHTQASAGAMQEIERIREHERITGVKRKSTDEILRSEGDAEDIADVRRFLDLSPLTVDVNPGQVNTDGKASSAFTSTMSNAWTSNATRIATAEEIRDARWKIMRKLGKKGFVQLQTTHGNLNIEIHCDTAMRTSWNFLTLCKRGYYDNTKFHRLVAGFVLQGGDPTGTGCGGGSAFNGKPFRDEFDNRLLHDNRGILSMANAGPNTNTSQFFITLAAAKHLDYKHPVFGRVVGGISNLQIMEDIGSDKNEKPLQDISIITAIVFQDPIDEVDTLLEEMIRKNIRDRLRKAASSALPTTNTTNTTTTTAAKQLTNG